VVTCILITLQHSYANHLRDNFHLNVILFNIYSNTPCFVSKNLCTSYDKSFGVICH